MSTPQDDPPESCLPDTQLDKLPPPPPTAVEITPPLVAPAARGVTPGTPGPPGELPAIPGHHVVEELGRGGMGVVYKARHDGLRRLVALKMIRADARIDPQLQARFLGEARIVAGLRHANVVQIHEVGQWCGQTYLSLEYVEGGSLDDRLHGTPLPPAEAARLVEVLARAMQAAHDQGVIHRDLKPANIWGWESGPSGRNVSWEGTPLGSCKKVLNQSR